MIFLFIPRVKTGRIRDQQQQQQVPAVRLRLFSHLAFLLPQRRLGWSNLSDLDHHHVSCHREKQQHTSTIEKAVGWDLIFCWYSYCMILDKADLFGWGPYAKMLEKKEGLMVSKAWGGWWMSTAAVGVTRELPLRTLFRKSFRNRRTSNWNPGTSHPNIIWVVVSNIFYFHPYLGKIPILTNIFQRGWNHQLVILCLGFLFSWLMWINDAPDASRLWEASWAIFSMKSPSWRIWGSWFWYDFKDANSSSFGNHFYCYEDAFIFLFQNSNPRTSP